MDKPTSRRGSRLIRCGCVRMGGPLLAIRKTVTTPPAKAGGFVRHARPKWATFRLTGSVRASGFLKQTHDHEEPTIHNSHSDAISGSVSSDSALHTRIAATFHEGLLSTAHDQPPPLCTRAL